MDRAELARLAGTFAAAVIVSLVAQPDGVSEDRFVDVTGANCEANNSTKALARELVAISPVDPDVTPLERQRFAAQVARLTRPLDCGAISEP